MRTQGLQEEGEGVSIGHGCHWCTAAAQQHRECSAEGERGYQWSAQAPGRSHTGLCVPAVSMTMQGGRRARPAYSTGRGPPPHACSWGARRQRLRCQRPWDQGCRHHPAPALAAQAPQDCVLWLLTLSETNEGSKVVKRGNHGGQTKEPRWPNLGMSACMPLSMHATAHANACMAPPSCRRHCLGAECT